MGVKRSPQAASQSCLGHYEHMGTKILEPSSLASKSSQLPKARGRLMGAHLSTGSKMGMGK